MKSIFSSLVILFATSYMQAQQVSVAEMARMARFDKVIDELNNGPKKLNYSEVSGSPYYYKNFVAAKLVSKETIIPIRYNTLNDIVEFLNFQDVYELPKNQDFGSFIFETTKEKLVLIDTFDQYSGYFFEINSGKNKLLKKIITVFKPEVPAPNTLISGTPPKFETLAPLYFIKTQNDQIIKIPRTTKEFLDQYPENREKINDFIKSNKIKLNREDDLIKLVSFLNG